MKKKALLSLLVTVAVVLSSFGTVLATVYNGITYFGSTIYDYSYDNAKYELSLTKTSKPLSQYTPEYINGILTTAKKVNLYDGTNNSNYGFSNFSSLTSLEYLKVYGNCNQLTIGNNSPKLERITFDDNDRSYVYIDLSDRESALMPVIVYDEFSASKNDTEFYLEFENFIGASTISIPADYGRDPRIDYDFEHSDSIKNVTFLLGNKRIPDCAFNYCKNLESVSIPKTVTRIEYSAFRGCSSLKSVKIPSSVNYIGMNAFKESGIKDITFGGTVAQWMELVREYDNSGKLVGKVIHLNGTFIHCSDGDLKVIKSQSEEHYEYRYIGWHIINGYWHYYDNSGSHYYHQTAQIDGQTYGFDDDGRMITGWAFISNKWYYFNQSGAMQFGWINLGGTWYFLNSNGVMQTGWVLDGGKWYYLNSSGAMQTGWVLDGGKWYYMTSSGVMTTGWVSVGGKWYYMNSSGVMQTGWVQTGNRWYYMNSSGVMQTGWLYLNGYWYYLEPGSGAMVTGSRTIGGKTYNFNSSGVCLNP